MNEPSHIDPGALGGARSSYGAHWLKVIREVTGDDPTLRDRAAYAVAEEARINIRRLSPVGIPRRPGSIPDTDEEILEQALDARKTAKNSPRGKMLAMLGIWRNAVWSAEDRNAGKVLVLLRAHHTFRRLSLGGPENQIVTFLTDEYSLRDEIPPPPYSMSRLAKKLTTRFDALSWELRHMERLEDEVDGAHPEDDNSMWKMEALPEIPKSSQDEFGFPG